MYGASAKQEGSSLDDLRRSISSTREAFAKQKAHDVIARKAEKGSKAKEPSSLSSLERTEYEEKLREYRNAVLEASKSETDPKKKAALLREALIDTTVKEVDELWTAQRRAKAEAKGGSGAWEKLSKLANRTVEGYRHLSWKQKLAISGALLVGANTGIPLVMGGAAVGIAAQRILSAGSAAMGIDALVKRFGIDRSRINEILGKDIRKEKDSIVLAEKLSALLSDENNGLNAQIFGIEGRKTKEVILRGAAGAAIFGSVVLGVPAKAIGQGVEHIAGDKIRAVRSIAGRAVHKMAGFFVGSAEGSIPPGGTTAIARGGVLATEEKLALDRMRQGVSNRMAFNEGYGQENKGSWPDETDRLKSRSSREYPDESTRTKLRSSREYPDESTRAKLRSAKGYPDEIDRLKSRSSREYPDESNRAKLRSAKGWPDESMRAGMQPQEVLPKENQLSFHLEKGGSVEGTINQYLKAHVEDIKARPELQKALGWDGDPKSIGRASHRLWLKMVDDVRVHPDTIAHKKLIEQLEQAGFDVREAIKDTRHPERLTKLFDAVARRMPIGMEFTVNPQTGTMEFSDSRFGKTIGNVPEAADSSSKKIHRTPLRGRASRLQEMLDEKHWQETDESMARIKQNIDELKQSTQDAVDRAADEQQIRHLEKRAELSAQGDIEQAALAFKRGDSQLQKLGLVARERNAWLADKTTRVQDVLRQIPADYDLGRGGAGNDINLPHQEEYRWGAVLRQIKLARYLREAMERAHLRFDGAGIPKNFAVRDMTIGQFLSNVNPQTGALENTR